ncbi:MAG: 3-deoxy-manno-octulosonate cytidylyltransferase [Bacteroidota bacterium]
MIYGIIPARFASTRFPGKPLIDLKGKSMIQRVYAQCLKAEVLDKVIVATDDQRIFDHVKSFGGTVELTAQHHASGTERVAEVAGRLPQAEIVVNIQGDEPLLDPRQIESLVNCLQQSDAPIATLARNINPKDITNPNVVKLVRNKAGKALYFSRSAIPFVRGEENVAKWATHTAFWQHIGLYAFKTEVLHRIPSLSPSPLEVAESLEQLRWLYHGLDIAVAETDLPTHAIDHPEDVERILKLL